MESDHPEHADGTADEPIALNPVTMEPATYGEPSLNAMSPMGQVEAYGQFARGLGPRRVKTVLVIFALFLVVPVLISVFS